MDGTASLESFQQAARFDSELTDRQREVLRLIAAGKTNGEIAEALDMTLAGAKWHVSEVLTKLALPTREDAAAYYRWREAPARRLSRLVRGLAPMAWWKIGIGAAGVAGAAIAGFIVVNGLHQEAPDVGPAVPGLPFAMDATVTRSSDSYSTVAKAHYWYGDSSRLRIEWSTPDVVRGDIAFGLPGTSALVFDGTRRWYGGTGPSSVYESRELLEPDGQRPWGVDGTYLGPLSAATIDEYAASPSSDVEVIRVGHERLLGIPVEVVDWVQQGDPPGEWRRREWIDPARMLVLKSETRLPDGDGLTIGATVTRLKYGEVQPPVLFEWRADPGAIELTCKGFEPPSPRRLPPPFPSVPASALPAGWELKSFGLSSTKSGDCGAAHLDYALDPTGPVLLQVRQDAESPANVVPTSGERIEGWLTDAVWSLVEADGNVTFAWLTREVGVSLRSSVLRLDALQAIAEAMLGPAR